MAMQVQTGGNAQPPYLQGKAKPMITPKASAVPGEVKPQIAPMAGQAVPPTPAMNPAKTAAPYQAAPKQGYQPGTPGYASLNIFQRAGLAPQAPAQAKPAITPKNAAAATPAASANNPLSPAGQASFDYLKGELEDERRLAEADTTASAASRGVYYGTPLTTSLGDIKTQYLKGLGKLSADVQQNEQQNQLERLRIAAAMSGQPYSPQAGGMDQNVLQMLGSLLAGSRSGPTAKLPPAGPMKLPVPNDPVKLRGVTPKPVS